MDVWYTLYMSLIEDLRRIQDGTPTGPVCKVLSILQDMDSKTRQELIDALDDDTLYGTTIAKVLVDRGYDVTSRSIQRHRRNQCMCPTQEPK